MLDAIDVIALTVAVACIVGSTFTYWWGQYSQRRAEAAHQAVLRQQMEDALEIQSDIREQAREAQVAYEQALEDYRQDLEQQREIELELRETIEESEAMARHAMEESEAMVREALEEYKQGREQRLRDIAAVQVSIRDAISRLHEWEDEQILYLSDHDLPILEVSARNNPAELVRIVSEIQNLIDEKGVSPGHPAVIEPLDEEALMEDKDASKLYKPRWSITPSAA
jgi:phosphoenolpyruvate-protein kinase (PTS system EI component)